MITPATPTRCVCSAVHTPAVLEPQRHHLWPVFLGGPATHATLVLLCPTTHTNVHRILRAMLKAGTWLPRALGEPHYSHQIATLGFQAWDAAGRPTHTTEDTNA